MTDQIWPWLATTLAVTVGALAAHFVLWRVLMRILRRWRRGDQLYARCHGPTRALVVVAALMVLIRTAPGGLVPIPDEPRANILHGLLLVLIAVVAWLVTRVMHVATDALLARHDIAGPDSIRARRIHTQADVLRRVGVSAVTVLAIAAALLTFEQARTLGTSLLASAGIAGVIVGVAARSTIGNLVGGLQIAFAELIRLEDVVVVEGEWGRVEEITLTYVVVRIWDNRRLILPTTYFIDQPFQSWTRSSSELLGTVYLHADYTVQVDALRAELARILETSLLWNKQVATIQVVGATERTVELRVVVSADNAGDAWDLRCDVREKLLAYLQREHPDALPRVRAELSPQQPPTDATAPGGAASPTDRAAQRRGRAAT